MRFRLVAGLILAAAAAACHPQTPQAPSPVVVNVGGSTQVVTIGAGGAPGSATPAPGQPGNPGTPAGVKVRAVGESCPGGADGSGQNRAVKKGCTKFITCTPFKSDGSDFWAGFQDNQITPPSQFGPVANAQLVEARAQANPYNMDVKGLAVGDVTFTCTVLGVSSANDLFVLSVVP